MERQRFRELCALLREACRGHRQNPRCTHSDATIVRVLLWAAMHDKSVNWACQAKHWPAELRPRRLPDQSTVSRRQYEPGVLTLIERFESHMREQLPTSDIKLIDGRPLCVGGCSKDPDAKSGHAAGHIQRGYKMHTLSNRHGVVEQWLITAMNGSETEAATLLLEHVTDAAYILADPNYDANHLYEKAGERGIQWLAKPKNRKAKGLAHQRNSAHRVKVQPWLRDAVGQRVMNRELIRIEQVHAWQGWAHVGLRQLPQHVRRRHRVQLWVALKLVLYHHWLVGRVAARNAAA